MAEYGNPPSTHGTTSPYHHSARRVVACAVGRRAVPLLLATAWQLPRSHMYVVGSPRSLPPETS